MRDIRPLEFKDGKLFVLDQNLLPDQINYIECQTPEDVAISIREMKVRGAPAIGVAAAYGLALAIINEKREDLHFLVQKLRKAAEILKKSRPTAYNLFWAIERITKLAGEAKTGRELKILVIKAATEIMKEDLENNFKIGKLGATLLKDGMNVLTHCNAGGLATAGYGTALGVIKSAWDEGKRISVYATETRPRLQGARLTAFELKEYGIPVTLVTDNMVGYLMYKKTINAVVVGADRILFTGHVINKIGTYQIALLAGFHRIPFYIAAPTSTFDFKSKVDDVIIEERDEREVLEINGIRISPKGVKAFNPAFDITPPQFISAIITERGIIRPPYDRNLPKILDIH